MLKDITIGQYFPGNSFVHKLDARFKILITALFIVMIFTADNFAGLFLSLLFFVIAFAASKLSLKLIVKSMKPIIPIIIFTSVLNIFFIDGVTVFKIFGIRITDNGLITSGYMIIRLIALICGSSLLTYTTSPIVLTDAIEQILKPLSKLKFPTHELAMMMTIALRFIPTLIEEADKITKAQTARGADFEAGSLIDRAKAMVTILVPLFVSAFRRADELAMAMESRCYHGGEGRTRMTVLKYTKNDLAAALSMALLIGMIIAAQAVT